MSFLQTTMLLSYAILLWGAMIAIAKTFIAASEVVFARVESKHKKYK